MNQEQERGGRNPRRQLQWNLPQEEQKAFSLCWENVQLSPHRKHQGPGRQGQFQLMALCFAAKHRTSSLGMVDQAVREATDLNGADLLPSQADFTSLRNRMIVLVERILVCHIPALSNLSSKVCHHLHHRYSAKMREATEVTNLGVIHADPSSTAGTIEIMEYLNRYIPMSDNGEQLHRVPCNGDGLSIERMVNAQKARARAVTPEGRLQGLVPSPQEFHKEGILMQVLTHHIWKSPRLYDLQIRSKIQTQSI